MYTRELTAPPEKIIQDGKPVFGSFSAAPDRLDISDITNHFHDGVGDFDYLGVYGDKVYIWENP